MTLEILEAENERLREGAGKARIPVAELGVDRELHRNGQAATSCGCNARPAERAGKRNYRND